MYGARVDPKKMLLSAAIAGVIAGTSGCSTSDQQSSELFMGECHGVNTCKGQGACGGTDHSCAGQNECRGQGWLKMSKDECNDQGGKFKS